MFSSYLPNFLPSFLRIFLCNFCDKMKFVSADHMKMDLLIAAS